MKQRKAVTRQGVRDLGNNARIRADHRVARCFHVWEDAVTRDCWSGEVIRYKRCGNCHEERR